MTSALARPAPESHPTYDRRLACDGGGALGHPRVYLTIGADGFIDCPYCDRRYVLQGTGHGH